MLAAWLLCKALWPRFAVVAALVIGALIAAASGDVASAAVPLAFVTPEWVAPQFTPALLLSVGLPFFLVTMASQNAPGFATLQASGYTVPVSALIVVCGGLALLLAPFGVYSICIAAITAAICQSPEAHPDPNQRWLAAIAAGGFYLLARSVRRVNHRPDVGPAAGVDPDAGGSGAARHHRRESVSGGASGQ